MIVHDHNKEFQESYGCSSKSQTIPDIHIHVLYGGKSDAVKVEVVKTDSNLSSY